MSSIFAVAVVFSSLLAAPQLVSYGADVAAAPAAARADDMFEGRVVLSNKAMLTIVAKNGDNVSFAISSSCKITRDGKASSADMIAPGDRVMIAATTDSGRNVANIITARAAERPASE